MRGRHLWLVVFIVSCIFFGNGWEEARAFIDEFGRVHVGGEIYVQEETGEGDVSADAISCAVGMAVPVTYGGSESRAVLEAPLQSGMESVLACSSVFKNKAWGGPIVLRCDSGFLAVEMHCGCARNFTTVPEDCGLRKARSAAKSACVPSKWHRETHLEELDVVWLQAEVLEEGHAEWRDCDELRPAPQSSEQSEQEQWAFRCFDGQLELSADRCQCSSGSSARRLADYSWISVCAPPPNDTWWPEICSTLTNSTVVTIAGAQGVGNSSRQFNVPRGIAMDLSGFTIVTDSDNNRLQLWSEAEWNQGEGAETLMGDPAGSFGNYSDTSRLYSPVDVSISGCRDAYVADELNHRIILYRPGYPDGIILVGIDTNGTQDNQLNRPNGVFAQSFNQHIFIADTYNQRVTHYIPTPPNGDYQFKRLVLGTTAVPGSGPADLNLPKDVYLDRLGNVFICDTGNNRILKVDASQMGSTSTVIGTCNNPTSVHIDNALNAYVSCTDDHCVQRWDYLAASNSYAGTPTTVAGECGIPVTSPLGTFGDAVYEDSLTRLNSPQGVYVDAYGSLIVSDSGNNRVLKFGRPALSQWILRNAESLESGFEIEHLEFYTDLSCTQRVPARDFISSNLAGELANWSAQCVGGCEKYSQWAGSLFYNESGIRCIKTRLTHLHTQGIAINVAYWSGKDFESFYEFGGIKAYINVTFRLPRFVPYNTSCVKGDMLCVLIDVLGDWQNDGDKIMVKRGECLKGTYVTGFPNGGISNAFETDRYKIGIENQVTPVSWLAANAMAGDDYKICWCDSQLPGITFSCQVPGDFTNILVGYVRVVGPFDGQNFDVYRGQFLVLENLQGVELGPGDAMTAVSGQCGPISNSVVGLVNPEGDYSVSNPSLDGTTFDWGTTYAATPVPGVYTLCWCRQTSANTCSSNLDFRGSAGWLTVKGPNTGQNFVCVSGFPCHITLLADPGSISYGDTLDAQTQGCGASETLIEGFPQKFGYNSENGNVTDFNWGPKRVTASVGLYFICWCSAEQNCTYAEEHRADVGLLSINGPEVKNVYCTLGRYCNIIRVVGIGLGNGDRVMVTNGSHFEPNLDVYDSDDSWMSVTPTDDCTLGISPLVGFPGDSTTFGVRSGISEQASGRGREFSWGDIDYRYVTPGRYKICWCHRNRNCLSVNNYLTNMGMLEVTGPFPARGAFVCGAGKTCSVSIDAVDPQDSDKMIVTKGTGITGGCGLYNSLAVTGLTVAQATSSASMVLGRQQHRWTSNMIPHGGESVICWCSVNCINVGAFNVRVGKLGITAPNSGSVNTDCLSSLPCTVRLTGIGLLPSNKLAMIAGNNGCGSGGTFAPDIPNSATSINTTVVDFVNKNVSDFIFGTAELPIRSAGATFTACWCSDGCSVITEFIIDVGTIRIVAPFKKPASDEAVCWQGLQCNISNIQGIGLTNANKLQIITLCGDETASEGGVPNRGISVVTENSGSKYSWGETRITSQPQEFELCWCSGEEPCTSPENFVTLIGILVVGGPYAGQMRFCFVGQDCSITDIKGLRMRRLDTVVLLETWCGQGQFIEGSPAPTGDNNGLRPWEAVPCGVTQWVNTSDIWFNKALLQDNLPCVNFYVPTTVEYTMELLPQMYRTCWCSAISDTCDKPEDFTVDVGLMTLSGPTIGQVHLCFSGFPCTMHNILGVSLQQGDHWLVKRHGDNCSSPGFIEHFADDGFSLPATSNGKVVTWAHAVNTTVVPGEYMVCWCPGHTDAVAAGIKCDTWDEYNAQGGFIQIVGPNPFATAKTCAVGSECTISDINGLGLQDGDRVLVIEGIETECGSPNAKLVPDFSNNGLSGGAANEGSQYKWPRLPKTLKGGTHNLCWCPASRKSQEHVQNILSCVTSSGAPLIQEFNVFIGRLTIPGTPVNNMQKSCIAGKPCVVDGVGGVSDAPLVNGAQIMVKKITASFDTSIVIGSDEFKAEFCLPSKLHWGSAVLGFSNASWPTGVSDGATMGGASYTWNNKGNLSALGGVYHMCWRAPPPPETYEFYVGTLTVVGPAAASLNIGVCTKSLICIVEDIKGTQLSANDYVKVGGVGCNSQTSANIAVQTMKTSTEIVWEGATFTAPVGKYSICWCHHSRECIKDKDEDYLIVLGSLNIRGPLAGQSNLCARGEPCAINIAGVELKAGDKCEVHVECGQGPRVEGFSSTSHADDDIFPTATAFLGGSVQKPFRYQWIVLRAKPGIYRICYCAESECSGSGPFLTSDFVNEVGIMTVQGPADLEQAAPVYPEDPLWGRDWNITLKGLRLHTMKTAQLRLLRSCGLCKSTHFNELAARPIEETPVATASPNTLGTEFVFDGSNMTLPQATKEYCLCWCQGTTPPQSDDCNSLADFTLDIGRVTMYCPAGEEPTRLSADEVVCTSCIIGRYKPTYTNDPCDNCTDPNHITSNIGAMHKEQCICKPGTYAESEDGGTCYDCPVGQYCEGGFQKQACMQRNFCPIECIPPATKVQLADEEEPHLCESETNCLINWNVYCKHIRPQDCPSGSGAWPEEDCPLCTGVFPAWNASSCSCQEGYAPAGDMCKMCALGDIKAEKGNASCEKCSLTLSGSTTEVLGSLECGCGKGDYMQTDESGEPLLCSSCPVGFYCPGFTEKKACQENKTTAGVSASDITECFCGPGYFKTGELCSPCAAGGKFYKDKIGDERCLQECPPHSRIPPGYIGGPRGVESCACEASYQQVITESTGEMFCNKTDAAENEIQTSSRVPSVKAYIVLSKVSPGTVNDKNVLLRQVVASELGLASFERVDVKIVSWEHDIPEERRLQADDVVYDAAVHADISTTASESESSFIATDGLSSSGPFPSRRLQMDDVDYDATLHADISTINSESQSSFIATDGLRSSVPSPSRRLEADDAVYYATSQADISTATSEPESSFIATDGLSSAVPSPSPLVSIIPTASSVSSPTPLISIITTTPVPDEEDIAERRLQAGTSTTTSESPSSFIATDGLRSSVPSPSRRLQADDVVYYATSQADISTATSEPESSFIATDSLSSAVPSPSPLVSIIPTASSVPSPTPLISIITTSDEEDIAERRLQAGTSTTTSESPSTSDANTTGPAGPSPTPLSIITATTILTTTVDPYVDLPPMHVTVEVTVWQPTYIEAKDLFQTKLDHRIPASTDTLNEMQEVISLDEDLKGVQNVTFNRTSGIEPSSMEYMTLNCEQHTGIVPETIFEGLSQSCQCMPGFEPQALLAPEARLEWWPNTSKCSPCISQAHAVGGSVSRGRYKDKVGDVRCFTCRIWKATDEPGVMNGFTSTVTFLQDGVNVSIYESQCACFYGYYRDRDLCYECTTGYYCTGDNLRKKCPVNTNTLPQVPLTDNKNLSDCECEKGFFLAFDTQKCEMCDPGYYKDDIANGPGRCIMRCAFSFGFRSTSAEGQAATSLDDCFCQPGSFLRNTTDTQTCEACPPEGVECLGGFENTTDPNVTKRAHRKPTTIEEFWMIDVNLGVATQCRTKGVCLKNNECLEGQKDFICGACSEMWTRDNFQTKCRDCSKFPSSTVMIFQIFLDLTIMVAWNGFLTASAVSKTEAQKNILTVLLRMYTHWQSQVTVLFNFDLSSLTSLYGEEQKEAEVIIVTSGNTTNITEPEKKDGFPWPSWQKEITETLLSFSDIIPSIGSTQEVLECFVDRHWEDPSGVRKAYWKLMIPALYWLSYPVIMVLWVIVFGWLGSRLGVGGYQVVMGEKTVMSVLGVPMSVQKRINKMSASKGKRGEKGDKDTDSQGSSDESDSVFSSEDSVEINVKGGGLSDGTELTTGKKRKDDPANKDWTNFATTMNPLTVLPNRFALSQGNANSKADAKAPQEEEEGSTERILVFFKPDTSFKMLVMDDIAPWIVVTLNNVWVPVTGRLLQMLYCGNFPEGNVRLMMNTMVECWVSPEHQHLFFVGMCGLLLWSIGIVVTMYAIIKKYERAHDLQNATIQRTFGYLLEGYEPKCWNWELTVKKMDLLATSLITYTSLASDTRAKILLYAVLASMAITFQISYTPYDNRSGNLLDSVENFGLGARFLMFWGVAICLLFSTSKIETAIVAAVVVLFCVLFLAQLFLYGIDDWATSQHNVIVGKIILRKKELLQKRKKLEADTNRSVVVASGKGEKKPEKISGKQTGKKPQAQGSDFLLRLQTTWRSTLKMGRGLFNVDYRNKQRVCFDWCGPTSDACLHKPDPTSGIISQEEKSEMGEMRKVIANFRGNLNRRVWHLDSESQIDFAVESIQSFTYHVIVSAKFGQLPARLTDLMMLLAASIKSLRWELINNPNPKPKKKIKKDKSAKEERPPWAKLDMLVSKNGTRGRIVARAPVWKIQWEDKKVPMEVKSWKGIKKKGEADTAEAAEGAIVQVEDEEEQEQPQNPDSDDEVVEKGNMQQLKAMILRDLFDRLWEEQRHRKDILSELKPKLTHMLRERNIPEELAWEVLDRMNTAQIEATRANPTQVLLRIRFFEFLLQCDCSDKGAALQRIQDLHVAEETERAEVMQFLQFMLRSDFENRTMPWSTATKIFDRLPVEELRHLGNDRERCLEMLDKVEAYENEDARTIPVDAVTVEDLNHMLMYLQKFTYSELHEIMEYTQMLLDFLQLPSSEVWRNHFTGQNYQSEEPDEDNDTIVRPELREIRDRDPEIFRETGAYDDDDEDFIALFNQLQQDLRRGRGDSSSRNSNTSSTLTPGSGSGNTPPEIFLKGRQVPEKGKKKGLPTVSEERSSSEQDPLTIASARRTSRAVQQMPTSRGAGGAGLANNDRSSRISEIDGPNPYNEDDKSWDSDDDDPAVNLGGIDLEVRLNVAQVENRSSLAASIDMDIDNDIDDNNASPNFDVLSVGASSAAQSDTTDLTGFSSTMGSARGRIKESLRPPEGEGIAPMKLSPTGEWIPKSGSNTSTSGSVPSEAGVETTRRLVERSKRDEISKWKDLLED